MDSLDEGIPSSHFLRFGCRRQLSNTRALVPMTHEWQTALDPGGAVRALLVDFKKAFAFGVCQPQSAAGKAL